MSKYIHNIFYAAVAILATLSCSQEEPFGKFKEGEAPLYFLTKSAEIEQATTKTADDAMWVAGMKVAVMIDGQIKPYEVSEINSTITNEALLECSAGNVPFYWNSTTEQKVVTAWAPYSESDTEYPISVKVRADQSKLENYIASNHILACDMSGGAPTAANRPGGQTVTYSNPTLSFTHRTAKIRVNLGVKEGESLNLDGAVVELLNVADSTIICYNASENGTYKYSALIPEVNLASGSDFIKVTLKNGITYIGKSSSATLFKENTQNIFTVTLEDRGAAIELESIEAWAQGETIDQSITVGNGYRSLGDGNSRVYYVTNSDGLLAWLNHTINGSNRASCVLLDDIALSLPADGSANWRVIQNYQGTFDGNGYKISNLRVIQQQDNGGFVRTLGKDGVIKNLTLDSTCSITVPYNNSSSKIGSIAAQSYGAIINCHSSASIYSHGCWYVGGLVGHCRSDANGHAYVIGCSFSGKIYVDRNRSCAGGIVGDFAYSGIDVMQNARVSMIGCYSDGTIEVADSRTEIYAGGIIGRYQYRVGSFHTIAGCYSATKFIVGTSGTRTAGLIGVQYGINNNPSQWANDSTLIIRYCYWPDDNILGLAGSEYDTSTSPINEKYNTATNIFIKGVQSYNNSNLDDWTAKQFTKRMNSAIQTWNTNNPGNPCNYRYGTKYNIGPLLEEGAPQ